MATLSEPFARRLLADPDQTHTVTVTLQPDAAEHSPPQPDADALAGAELGALQPVAGLQGIYQGNLTGHDILRLRDDQRVQAIEPDDIVFTALGE
jgi:hypothetical protein